MTFVVFESETSDARNADKSNAAYLLNRAAARYVERFFIPLWDQHGIGISSSDDQVVRERGALEGLCRAIREAIAETERQPGEWTEIVGYRGKDGPAIAEAANRADLLTFLRQALQIGEQALRHGTYVVWAGCE